MNLCSDLMNIIHSDIRGENFMLSLEMEKNGIDILKLNTGNPATFGFGMPESVRAALIENMDRAVGYCDVRGMIPARLAIEKYQRSKGITAFDLDNIFLGNGISEIASMITTALLGVDDEVLMPTPCYSLWSNETLLKRAKPVYYRCCEEQNWAPDLDHIRSLITPKTKVLILINPNNPTGVLYSKKVLEELIEIARANNLIILSDEIYDRLVFDGKTHISTASLADDVTIVTMNGLSKSHCLCGFRCGWMVISGPEARRKEISESCLKIASVRLSANALMQTIVPVALEDTEYTDSMIRPGGRLYEQRKATHEALCKIEGVSFVPNDAAFYVFPKLEKEVLRYANDKEFARDLLLDKHILIVPGSGFDWPEPNHFRIVMLPQPDLLSEAIEKIGDFIHQR